MAPKRVGLRGCTLLAGVMLLVAYAALSYEFGSAPALEVAVRHDIPIATTDKMKLVCRTALAYESGCEVVAELDSIGEVDIGYWVEYGALERKIVASPTGQHVLLANEKSIKVLEMETLRLIDIARAEPGTDFGVWTEFPSFIPFARWIDENSIEVGVFPENTIEVGGDRTERQPINLRYFEI